ncbi:MAG: hypothetical protein M0P69_19785, partial [Bacteroidales bacterium]|nr:hypothetical protein [Bacteroidales bacterium]
MGNATNSIWNEIWALKRAVGTFTGADTQVSRLLPPRNLAVRGGFKSLHITWENQKYTSLPHTEIFLSETENIADGRSIATVMSNAYSIFDLDVIRPYWVWARGVDLTSWKYSDWAGPVSAITNGLEEEDFLVGEIAESALAPALAEKIDFINLLDLKFEDKIDYIDLIDLKLEDYVVDLTDMYQYVINEFNTLSTSIVDYLENTSELYTTITNAGIITDPETGTVQIFGLEAYKTENDARLSSVELNIDAVESTLTSKVTLAEVDERIAGAVFGDAGELLLSGVDARVSIVEETLDGVEAELLEKATYVEVYELGGRMGTAETRLDGMDAEIDLLATSTELDAVEERVTTAEININAVEGKITQAVVASVTLTQDEEEMLADGLVNAMLNDHEWNTYATEKANSVIAIAKTDLYAHIDIVETDLYSHIDDVLTAEAGERTLLAAQIAGNTGAIQSESVVRANADYALSSEITTLQSEVGANASAIQTERTTRANADSALSSEITTLQSEVGANASAIQTEATTRANADSAEAT